MGNRLTENDLAEQRETTARKVKDLRTSQDLSLRQLGLMAGMDYRHINRIEHGEISPRVETLRKLAAALGVTVHDLI